MKRKPAPFLSNGPKPNHVQLLHLDRPRKVREPCDTCGALFNDRPTHWRVRAHISLARGQYEAIVGHFCSESCAREQYDALRVEIALITGEKPTRRVVTFDDLAKSKKDRGE